MFYAIRWRFTYTCYRMANSTFRNTWIANVYQLCSIFIWPNTSRMDVNFIEKFVDDPLSYCPLWEPNHPTFYPLMAKATPPEEEADLSSQKKDQ